MTFTGSLWCTAVRNSHISMLKPPSPVSTMTWRPRSAAWMPLAMASAVPTAALLNEPMICCAPLCRIQFADHNVLRPVIEDENGIALGQIARRARHGLRMNNILAARRIGLLVQHVIPLLAFPRDAI